MSRIGHLSRGLALPQQHDRHDRVAALSKMSGIGHIAQLLRYKGAACGNGPVAIKGTADALELAPWPPIPEAGRSLAHSSPNGRAIRPFFLPAQEGESWMNP